MKKLLLLIAIIMSFVSLTSATGLTGSGTLANPYKIYTAADLDLVRNYLGIGYIGTYFVLMNDIDLTTYLANGGAGYSQWGASGWLPIGTSGSSFYGVFDGNNHKITGLKIDRASAPIGLFGTLGDGGFNSPQSSVKNLGIVIDAAASVKGGGGMVGGLLGNEGDGAVISNCYVNGTVINTGTTTGGLVGYAAGGVENCFSSGSVTGLDNVGGLIGNCGGGAPNVVVACYSTSSVSGTNSLGGLVGIGQGSGSITNCFARGSVTSINNSYRVGGLLGGPISCTVTKCYSTGLVTTGYSNSSYFGGLFGQAPSITSVNSFWDTQTSGQTGAAKNGELGKTTAQMVSQGTFTNWDFTATWAINSSVNNGYPYLQSLPPAPSAYVKAGATGFNNGTSWANAYTDLQSALTALSGGGTIWVAAGTYKPGTGTPTRSSTFNLPSGIIIAGGFAGTEASVSARDIASNVTILSGDIGTASVATDNVYHVVSSSGTATMDGVTITAGRADGAGSNEDRGGAVYFSAGTLTIKNSIINNNYAGFSGGAVFIDGSATSLTLTNCLVTGNTSNSYAGAVGINAGAIFTNCTFSGNSAYDGGAFYVGAATTMNNSILWGNTASISSQAEIGATLTLNNSCYSNSYNDISGTTTPSNSITTDPQFVGNGSYSIEAGSPCVNTGNNTYNTESFDIRGKNYTRKNGLIDMGAYEYNANPLPVELASFTASTSQNGVTLNWKTATEVNNYGFEIERTTTAGHPVQANDVLPSESRDERNQKSGTSTPSPKNGSVAQHDWVRIGFVEGNGTTNAPKSYSFTDKSANGKISYRLKQIDRDGKFEYSQTVEVTAPTAPKEFVLEQNYPNPFNPTTAISFQLSAFGFTTLKIYDAIGREVATLVNEVKEAGTYTAQFDGAKLSSGIYFAKLTSDNKTKIRKLLLMK